MAIVSETVQRTGIYLASDNQLCFTNASLYNRAVLGIIIYNHILAVLNKFSRG